MKLKKISVRVKVIGQKSVRRVSVARKTRVADLLDQLGQNRETVAVRLNGKIIAEEEHLADGDYVEILPIVTGG